MSKIVKRHQPCLNKECGSSDARQIYEEGTSFCFACTTFFPKQEGEDFGKVSERDDYFVPKARKKTAEDLVKELNEIRDLPTRGFKERKITLETAKFFGVKVSYGDDGEINAHYYPYEGGKAFKTRELPKNFKWVGKSDDLFGRDKFGGGGKRLIIVEGEIDTLTVAEATFQKYGKYYPVVGMSSATMIKSILENREWIRSFKEVILCLDEDDAGREATKKLIDIIGIELVRVVKLPLKDPSEVFLKLGKDTLLQAIWDSSPYVPSGIIDKRRLWEELAKYNETPSHPYPSCLAGVNSKTKGKRLGEIALFVSGTGSGKSSLIREILYDVLQTTDSKVGVIALEEVPAETARKFSGLALSRNPAYEEIPLEDLKLGFDAVFGSDRVIVLDHRELDGTDSLVSKIEYMALAGCQYIAFDHITIAISEGVGELTGNEAQDKMMNDLAKVVTRRNIWLGLVSHLRKTNNQGKSFEQGKMPNMDDIRGSGSTKQVSFDIVAFARDMSSEKEEVRNTIKMSVLKCRFTGLTGPVNGAKYDFRTGRLHGLDHHGTESESKEEEFAEV